MVIPYHPRIKTTVDGMETHILSCQGQSQTNAVKAQDYGSSVLGPTRYSAGELKLQGTGINTDAYIATLRKLRRALQIKRYGLLSKGILLLHDNARYYTSRTTRDLIESSGWKVLYHAPYSRYLAHSDFHFLQYLKHSLT
ncbi:histone-lysine N-methyltransferase SETMAR [Trichonephila clavipes]|nr:histone-lysine N-methyltransferase SETMAR [Trichonephila clavipes]